MNKLLKTLITGIIIYAIFMVFIDCLFSFLSVAKQTDLDVLLIDKQIPQNNEQHEEIPMQII